ncbi:MAG: hypothetical protein ACYDCI_10260 [Candidatus Limnocylindrales bacterium]
MPTSEPTLLGLAEGTWIAIVALALGAVVSVAATLVAYKSQKEDRAHRAEQAREERFQARLQAAYADLATHLDRLGEAVSLILPTATVKPPPPPILWPDYEETRPRIALAKLLGSADVRDQFAQLNEKVMVLRVKVGRYETEVGFGLASSHSADAWNDAVAEKQLVLDAVGRLLDQMRTELGSNVGRDDPPRSR